MQTLSLYALTETTGVNNAALAYTSTKKGKIVAIQFDHHTHLTGAADYQHVELSWTPVFQGQTNDGTGILGSHLMAATTATGGFSESFLLNGVSIPLEVGDRLYLNYVNSDAASDSYVRILLYIV